MLIGLGKQVKKVVSQGPHTVLFSIYNIGSVATQTGDAPTVSDKMAGDTFTLPTQGNIVRTQTQTIFYGDGTSTTTNVNIPLYAWTDGNGLYFPGDTYTMPNSNITLEAIWLDIVSPSITSITPTSGSTGDIVILTGSGLASAQEVNFNRGKPSTFVVLNNNQIRATVPAAATTGRITVNTLTATGEATGLSPTFTKI